MEILKLLLHNSDTIIIGILTCYLYDTLKNHSSTGNRKSGSYCDKCDHNRKN
ncbi:hypothetical protein SDC9_117682 [bioreactor metagenome]|uniref:Uncharacterized protein n=1 Tax=bioreactor metagenome TaxID=1076179 RepID=A0A645C8I1_9ZZZZ|nr:hypothetical protein [Romboutsia lituseburensis]